MILFLSSEGLVYEILVERVMKEKLNYWTRGQLSTLTEEKLTALNAPREIVQLTNKYTDEMLLALAPLVYRNTPLDVERRERQCKGYMHAKRERGGGGREVGGKEGGR